MDSEINNPNIFGTGMTVGSGSSFPSETNSLNVQGANPQMPWTIGSGVTRGTQIIANADGSQTTLGAIPNSNNQYGIAIQDATGNVTLKIIGGTIYTYDAKNNYVNSFISGVLPDGSSGFVAAKPGIDATSLFS